MSAPAVCTTPACLRRGAGVKLNMDTSVDPCDNFYKFACGGWTSREEVPKYASVYGTFQALNKAVMYNMSHLLSRSYDSPEWIETSLYKGHSGCMLGGNDVGRDNEDAWNKIMLTIGVEEWPNGPGDVTIPLWSKLLGDLMTKFNHKPVVYIDVKRNRVVKKNIIHVKPGSLPVKREYLASSYYKRHMLAVIQRINTTTLDDQRLLHAVDEMVGFEKNLAEILSKQSNETESTFVSVTELENDVDLVQEMINFEQHIFYEEMKSSKWMSRETKAQGLSKLAKMKAVVGYPKWIADERKVALFTPSSFQQEFCKNLSLTPDCQRRKYDAYGALHNWWSPKTEAIFRKKSQCFVDQYGNITDAVTHMKLPSTHTLAEDISDNAAARLSFLAHLKLKETEKQEMQLLPGLESYTPEQLHFISAAQPWCKKYDPDLKKFVIEEDVHSISEERVNIPFGNTPQFAEVFKCPPGSKMNFAKKCRVW
ncbi:endothelin-converting enzyme homolog isoform X3 [Rhipicephalus sanguineus]|uniref:endothelin-converting enzyme homolog isoform X3 n=1 Tax=Rhipicephalus sanguineus TaxID=34632 RepID=UPI0020C45EDE|nr:endothelin-converting enzyme homolog isoform X3 [Rhipicephalus sanguineus]